MRRMHMIISRKDVLAARYDKVRYYQRKLDKEKGGDAYAMRCKPAISNLIINLIKEQMTHDSS